MARWGLTTEMRQLDPPPWGLDAGWLEPGKTILDEVHGDINTTVLEQAFIDTGPFQRLRRIRQLHGCHHVYPSATHSRLSHALGSLHMAQALMDRVVEQRFGSRPVPDLFSELDPGALPSRAPGRGGREPRAGYLRLVSEATLLARLAALLHDIGHLPFSHTVEDDLGFFEAHDKNEHRFAELWDEMLADMPRRLAERGRGDLVDHLGPLRDEESELRRNLTPLILHRSDRFEPLDGKYRFVADIVGDTICADLLDYLVRDHKNTGLPLALGDRFMSAFYVTPKARRGHPERMALLLHRNGRPRADVDDEVLKHLRYRYELTDRVYMHHTKLAGDAMLGRMLQHLERALVDTPEAFPRLDRPRRLGRVPHLTRARKDDPADRDGKRTTPGRRRLEQLMLSFGDDGLLELIASLPRSTRSLKSASGLARALLDRDLHELSANARGEFGDDGARRLHKRWGDADARRQLEADAAKWAGIRDPDRVLLWLPPPEATRLKLAGVLVDYGAGIEKFSDYSTKGQEIYDSHKRLWRICLFTHRSLTPDQRYAVAAHMAEELDVTWDAFLDVLGARPERSKLRLGARRALELPRLDAAVDALVDEYALDPIAAYSGGSSPTPRNQADLDRRVLAVQRARYATQAPRASRTSVDDV